MNTPITTSSKALADEGRLAAEEMMNAKNAIIAELAHVTVENERLKAELISARATIALLVAHQEA